VSQTPWHSPWEPHVAPSGLPHLWVVRSQRLFWQSVEAVQGSPLRRRFEHFILVTSQKPSRQSPAIAQASVMCPPESQTFVFGLQKLDAHV